MHGKVLVIVPDPYQIWVQIFTNNIQSLSVLFFIDICSNSLCSKWALFFNLESLNDVKLISVLYL